MASPSCSVTTPLAALGLKQCLRDLAALPNQPPDLKQAGEQVRERGHQVWLAVSHRGPGLEEEALFSATLGGAGAWRRWRGPAVQKEHSVPLIYKQQFPLLSLAFTWSSQGQPLGPHLQQCLENLYL